MRPIIYLFILFVFSTAALAQDQLVEILADSLFSSEVNDQSSAATGTPLSISATVYGGQSFIVDTTGILTRIEVSVRKAGFFVPDAWLSLEIKTGSDPGLGSSLITESFLVSDHYLFTVYWIVLTTPIQVTKGDALVMIVKKTSGGDAFWERSSTDVYAGGTAFENESDWIPLSNQDHWFRSYIEVPENAITSYFSIANDGLIKAKNRITNVSDPISAQDAATKAYVDLLEVTIIDLTPPIYTIGLSAAEGGYIFWVSSDGKHGLVAETVDQSTSTNLYEAQNLISDPSNHSVDGDDFRNWRLPTKYELNAMYLQKDDIGGFSNDVYWSSTEIHYEVAWRQDFSDGIQGLNIKDAIFHRVRVVRAF